MTISSKSLLLSALVSSASFSAAAQSWQDTVARIEQIFSRYNNDKTPGAQLAISRNGSVIFSKAWGMADLEHQVPLTPQSITEAGSVSKQFTAAAILLLEQQGKLSLDDDVRKHIGELRDYKVKITLRHLIQHTSGLKDWGSIMDVAGWPRGSRAYTNDYALYVISLQQSLNNLPGDEYIYSNSNYNLLAIIVQRVSGLSLADFTKKYIFEPAGMKNTEWRSYYRKIVPNRAFAYSRNGAGFQTNMPNESAYGNGGLLTTAEDLLIWNNYYLGGRLGNPSLFAQQTATRPLNNGGKNNYGAGLMTDPVGGWKAIAHSGATAGYRANLEYFPEAGLSIAWLSNTSAFDTDTLNVANAVRRLFLPVRRPENPPPRPAFITVPEEKLAAYAGWYRNPRTGGGTKLYIKDGKMSSLFPAANLNTVAENIFVVGNNRLEVDKKKGLLWISPGADSIYFDRVEPADTSEKNLQKYVGTYYSREAEAFYYIVLKQGKLFLELRPGTVFSLTPTYYDGFDCPFGPIHFIRDIKKGIVELKVSVSRARNITFRKVYDAGF
ncbi:serine hydrolase domain-containing protein [Paraflavitalea sp. CAU 1676]|uniref:serine hydrolase domain-containing protein n=1 Tax=Paraflavitalea sp. CAU 1676 TaxID=3032598 RepID=UPI0023DB7A0A|nr:serine hydrolase domain-containing protein [Paraflavitalea sp. CAU 1676]MDF2191068.1 serine hydrolase [Paraflavitalea sp. CAU 1676]